MTYLTAEFWDGSKARIVKDRNGLGLKLITYMYHFIKTKVDIGLALDDAEVIEKDYRPGQGQPIVVKATVDQWNAARRYIKELESGD